MNDYTAVTEAILFAAGQPLHITKLAGILGLDKAATRQQLGLLKDKYDNGHGIQLLELNDSFQLGTREEYANQVKEAVVANRETQLSPAAMEVISIIAYNQPITKGFIEEVRGVNSGQIVNALVEKGLVEEAGRLNIPGKPISYRTTPNFLRSFGLESLEQLPTLPADPESREDDDTQLEGQIDFFDM